MDSRHFSGHSYGASCGHFCDSSAFLFVTPFAFVLIFRTLHCELVFRIMLYHVTFMYDFLPIALMHAVKSAVESHGRLSLGAGNNGPGKKGPGKKALKGPVKTVLGKNGPGKKGPSDYLDS